jgi:hypothetical protein
VDRWTHLSRHHARTRLDDELYQLPQQRWAIIHYVRALQRAARPTEEDVRLAKMSPYTLDDDLPDTSKAQLWPEK